MEYNLFLQKYELNLMCSSDIQETGRNNVVTHTLVIPTQDLGVKVTLSYRARGMESHGHQRKEETKQQDVLSS